MENFDFAATFTQILEHQKAKELLQLFDIQQEFEVSRALEESELQDSWRYRAKEMGRCLAEFLIDQKGELKKHALERAWQLFKKKPFILSPFHLNDGIIIDHIHRVLHLLLTNPELEKFLKKFSMPLCHRSAETLIKETLALNALTVKNKDIRKAVLAAWLTPLRQMQK